MYGADKEAAAHERHHAIQHMGNRVEDVAGQHGTLPEKGYK